MIAFQVGKEFVIGHLSGCDVLTLDGVELSYWAIAPHLKSPQTTLAKS
ncbi:hypothetical protein [Leptolyngbya sp. FACHB-16]|nr:hypothetical protein [Leptolyngbya sp. FACHB-16]MBD2152947.1 hypothetical protein [Leptolyngbya sp. FACHB-16]